MTFQVGLPGSKAIYVQNNLEKGERVYSQAIDSSTLLGKAFLLWATAERTCKCTFHFPKDYKEERPPNECPRQKYWLAYTRIRDGYPMTEEDRAVLGIS